MAVARAGNYHFFYIDRLSAFLESHPFKHLICYFLKNPFYTRCKISSAAGQHLVKLPVVFLLNTAV